MSTAAENRLRKNEWTVRDVEIAVARRLVEAEHYAAGASNTAVYLHGLFREGDIFEEQCLGVAWWIPPTRSRCRFHGGLSTGPKTAAGIERLRRARTRHGEYSGAAKAQRRQLRELIRSSREMLQSIAEAALAS